MGFGGPTELEQLYPTLTASPRGDVGCILMHRDRTPVHQDAPYTVGVALGPGLRREERDKELAFVGGASGFPLSRE